MLQIRMRMSKFMRIRMQSSDTPLIFSKKKLNFIWWKLNFIWWKLNFIWWKLNFIWWKLNFIWWKLNFIWWKLNFIWWKLNLFAENWFSLGGNRPANSIDEIKFWFINWHLNKIGKSKISLSSVSNAKLIIFKKITIYIKKKF